MQPISKHRGRQAKPTKAEVSAAWSQIRVAADAGDLQAAAILVALAESKPLFSVADVAGVQHNQYTTPSIA